jgi:methoxymalonate biosynthesis acyl carrier protein
MSTQHEQHIKQTVRGFLLSSINVPGLKDEENLFEMGLVNSLFAVQLMTFIEKTFSLEVETEDLDIDNFKSLNATTEFVMKKTGGHAL